MTMFYSRADERYVAERRVRIENEQRMREIVREEIAKRESADRAEFIRTMSGDLVHVDDAMKGPPVA